MSTEFQVGDECTYMGVKCVVIKVDENRKQWPLTVQFLEDAARGHNITLTSEGKLADWHKEPALKLVKRAKKKVMMQMYCYHTAATVYCRPLNEVDSINLRDVKIYKIGKPFEVEVDE